MPYNIFSHDHPSWHSPPNCPVLQTNEIHVWKVEINPSVFMLDRLCNLLNDQELTRANRFKAKTHRNAFVAARGALRLLLSLYTGTDAQQLVFRTERHGKPFLENPSLIPPLTFNLAHSGELALYAISLTRKVGIDIEHHQPRVDHQALAKRICSPQEKSCLQKLPGDQQKNAFFSCWTRKEAYVKAIGKGLSFPLDTITVSINPDQPAALLKVKDNETEPDRWSMWDLNPGQDYSAALVGEGRDCKPLCWKWSWEAELVKHKA